jgi:hypothetical protein
MAIQQPRFVDGRTLAVDLQTPANAIAGGLTQMFDNQRQEQQAMAKQQQFDQANAVNAFSGSILQSDPQNWPEMFMAEASRYEQMGDMKNADESRRLAQLPMEEQTREMQQDFMSSSNALGRDPIAGLRQISGAGQKDLPSDVRETIWFNQQAPEVQKQHLELKRKAATDYAAMAEYQKTLAAIKAAGAGDKVTAETEAEAEASEKAASTAAKIAAGKVTGSAKASRQQGYIDSGIDAADALANIKRSQQLLESVETGGLDNAILWAKQKLGIESADEAELSGRLGKSILAQLRPIFGSAFTAPEGERLEKIESNFGKSTEGNKRLLKDVFKITERAARRGLAAAKATGDDFTVSEIQAGLDALKGMETDFTLKKSGDVDYSALEAKHGIK